MLDDPSDLKSSYRTICRFIMKADTQAPNEGYASSRWEPN